VVCPGSPSLLSSNNESINGEAVGNLTTDFEAQGILIAIVYCHPVSATINDYIKLECMV